MDAATFVGLPRQLDRDRAIELLDVLRTMFATQVGRSPATLEEDLEQLSPWFDPLTKGERIRKAIFELEPLAGTDDYPCLTYEVSELRHIITPEGRVAIDLLSAALANAPHGASPVRVPLEPLTNSAFLLASVYRSWSRQRLTSVVGVLSGEEGTLRPGAAGLLLVLLLNRNTAPERALPRPRDPVKMRRIDRAIQVPATAWAGAITGKPSSPGGVDLYRGWAMGELGRRLGPTLHLGFEEEGIYIEEPAVDLALHRLTGDLKQRPARIRDRVPDAWRALTGAYRRTRPQLASLGLAFERPSFTAHLKRAVLGAAQSDSSGAARTN